MIPPSRSSRGPRLHVWLPPAIVALPVMLVYSFAIMFRRQFGSWPDSPIDWVPLDRGGHEELVAFANLSALSVVTVAIAMLIWTLAAIIHVATPGQKIPPSAGWALLASWIIFGGGVLAGGATFMLWMLD